jgi:hypothetical protein
VRDDVVVDDEGLLRVEAEDLLRRGELVGAQRGPWILPLFCLPGEGQPMIVFRMISDGLSVSPLAASIAAYSSATSSTYSPVFFQSTSAPASRRPRSASRRPR